MSVPPESPPGYNVSMWVVLTLICAFSLASADAVTKRALGGGENPWVVGWLRLVFTAPPLLVMLFFIDVPPLDAEFWRAFITALPFEVAAFALYIGALRTSPMSLTIPFLALTPVFLVASGYVIAGERVTPLGAAGIALIAAGGYVLNFHHAVSEGGAPGRFSLLGPLRAVARERGVLMMLGVAFIYSITSSLGKVAINHSAPLFFASVYFIVLAVLYTPFALRGLGRGGVSRRLLLAMVPAGFLNALMVGTHMLAMSMTQVAYMIALKRTSLLFSIFYGWLLFREGHMRERAAGAAMMFAGFVLVVTAA
jgi:drug/metabolite transporter (DMT)-like permease